ncbi:hypothetical protein, variant 1 [Aphanomyces astaci]|uniref:DUF4211 domain-containing protein n=1 Tax=Aphanomyces astaci TaxID=112090 RepID=W4G5P2_APHAT|nr:hypothetical protein, variant 1 [Aphanomyces astaci]ETV74248.1 hypothetical protein, variant 1 [Aphanomyces astaci]|eukprot:XP_009836353.1 hypothetical protein, variant 1 [Aphanomyces astaci]
MDDSDDDVEIITPKKNQKRNFVDDEDEAGDVAAAMSQQTDDEVIVTSASKKQKRMVVLDESDDETKDDGDDAMPLTSFRDSLSGVGKAASPATNRRHSVPAASTRRQSSRRASRRLSDRGVQKEIEHVELKQKLKRKSLDTCLPKPASDDEFVGESDDDSEGFVVDDDVVEYMNEDEKPILAVEDEDGEDDEDAMDVHGSKEPIDWFRIYLTYIEECLLDESFETNPHIPALFKQSIQHVERGLLQRRDSLRGNVHWPSDLVESIDTMPQVMQGEADGDQLCYACNRSRHPAHYSMSFMGVACHAPDLYRKGWRQHLFECLEADNNTRVDYDLGSMCFQRVLLYWSLNQAKRQWCSIVWRKIVEHGGKRIPADDREKVHKTEYGRYKKLLGMVDGMELKESRQLTRVGNVWLNVQQMTKHSTGKGRRRGDLALLDEQVAESTEDSDHDVLDNELKEGECSPAKSSPKPATPLPADESDMCLVCHKRRRTGGVLHGYYVHVYCCFECAKMLKDKKKPCAVCARPMERVIHLLPLNDEEAARIRHTHG